MNQIVRSGMSDRQLLSLINPSACRNSGDRKHTTLLTRAHGSPASHSSSTYSPRQRDIMTATAAHAMLPVYHQDCRRPQRDNKKRIT